MGMRLGQKVYSTEVRPYDTCKIIKIRPEIGRYFAEYPDGERINFHEKDIHVTVFEEEEF